MPTGYNIQCDPGALGMQKCYVVTASGDKQEIIGYQDGNPISKMQSSSSWNAWIPTLTVLDMDGNAYQPYGESGLPYTATGIAGYDDASGEPEPTDSDTGGQPTPREPAGGFTPVQGLMATGGVLALIGATVWATTKFIPMKK